MYECWITRSSDFIPPVLHSRITSLTVCVKCRLLDAAPPKTSSKRLGVCFTASARLRQRKRKHLYVNIRKSPSKGTSRTCFIPLEDYLPTWQHSDAFNYSLCDCLLKISSHVLGLTDVHAEHAVFLLACVLLWWVSVMEHTKVRGDNAGCSLISPGRLLSYLFLTRFLFT